ncbi:MAG TPA: hypothetical protein VMI54_23775 [Polyangiaceae bacterium]|nr:hypothetical protein [Polyangiaceae bacterium]
MKVVLGLVACALLACGRSELELDPAPASASGGQTSLGGGPAAANGGLTSLGGGQDAGAGAAAQGGASSSVGLDEGALAAARCSAFALPPEAAYVTEAQGFPIFGACGHLTFLTSGSTPVWGPDLREILASARLPSFSPEGTRVIFVPAAPEDDRVRRLDLLTMQTFDTPVASTAYTSQLDFGLFLDFAGDVESWICSAGDLRIYADRVAGEQPVFETSVPSCSLEPAGATLVWAADSKIDAVDLRGRRLLSEALPPYAGSSSGGLALTLDGYAAARTTADVFANGPLYSLRDGGLLANAWEQVPIPGTVNNAANRLDPEELALLVDDGNRVLSWPGFRGLYVFRDKRRAFAFRATESGTAELVYLDLASGATTPIAEYSGHRLDPDYYPPTFGISPAERAAYFVLEPNVDPSNPNAARSGLVRWLDGDVATLGDTVPAVSVTPAVADEGTAVFMNLGESTRLRPGAPTLTVTSLLGLNVSDDGSVDLYPALMQNSTLDALVAMNLDDLTARTLVADLSTFTTATDFFHQRYAILLGTNGESTPHALWAGSFPVPSVHPK